MLTLSDLKSKVVEGNLTLTKDEALDIPMILNSKKGQICEYDWDEMECWVSIWDLTFKIED